MDDLELFKLFKTLHVIAVVFLGGGIVLEAMVGILAARASTVEEARVYGLLVYISENFLAIPAAIAIPVFGYLAADRIGYDLDINWLALGQVFFYTIVVLALLVLRPAANSLRRLTLEAPDGPVTPEIAAQLRKPLTAVVGLTTSVLFVATIYLMVSKPDL